MGFIASVEKCFGQDFDVLCGFTTPKQVVIRDRYLGLLSNGLAVATIVYLVVTVIVDGAYWEEAAPSGTARLSVEMPKDMDSLPDYGYCTNPRVGPAAPETPGKRMPCAYYDTEQIGLPNALHQLFIPTRVVEESLEYSCGDTDYACQKAVRDTSGEYPIHNETFKGFVYGIDRATVLLRHTVEVSGDVSIERHLTEMTGRVRDCAGNVVRTIPAAGSGGCTEADGSPNMTCDLQRRLFTVAELVSWARPGMHGSSPECAPIALDDPSNLNPAEADNTFRYDGVLLYVVLDYDNTRNGIGGTEDLEYDMRIIAFRRADPKYVTLDDNGGGVKTKTNRHGVYITVVQTGRVARFSWSHLVVSLTAGLGLLAVSATVTSFLARFVCPLKQEYTKLMFDESPDFSDYRQQLSETASPPASPAVQDTPMVDTAPGLDTSDNASPFLTY